MVDWNKRITKAAGNELPTGDNVIAATLLQPPGNTKMIAGGAVGGLVGMAVASKLKKRPDGELVSDEGIAASLPQSTMVVGLTSSGRVLFYSQSALSGKPKELKATLNRADIAVIEVSDGKLASAVTIIFADGTARQFESPRIGETISAFAAQFPPAAA